MILLVILLRLTLLFQSLSSAAGDTTTPFQNAGIHQAHLGVHG
jgi:hypothetical protein